jgi:hypothetical protein
MYRGLCRAHYQRVMKRIKSGKADEAEEIAAGRLLASRNHQGYKRR